MFHPSPQTPNRSVLATLVPMVCTREAEYALPSSFAAKVLALELCCGLTIRWELDNHIRSGARQGNVSNFRRGEVPNSPRFLPERLRAHSSRRGFHARTPVKNLGARCCSVLTYTRGKVTRFSACNVRQTTGATP
jgi:hypothetical protein